MRHLVLTSLTDTDYHIDRSGVNGGTRGGGEYPITQPGPGWHNQARDSPTKDKGQPSIFFWNKDASTGMVATSVMLSFATPAKAFNSNAFL